MHSLQGLGLKPSDLHAQVNINSSRMVFLLKLHSQQEIARLIEGV